MRNKIYALTMSALLIPMMGMLAIASSASTLEAGAGAYWVSGDLSGTCKIYKDQNGAATRNGGYKTGIGAYSGGTVRVDTCWDIVRDAPNECADHINDLFACQVVGTAVHNCEDYTPMCPE